MFFRAGATVCERGGVVSAVPFGALRGAVRAGVHCVLSVIGRLRESCENLPYPSLSAKNSGPSGDTLPKFCEFREGCAAEGQRAACPVFFRAGASVRERGRIVSAVPFGALRGAVRAGVHCVLSVIRRLMESCENLPYSSFGHPPHFQENGEGQGRAYLVK